MLTSLYFPSIRYFFSFYTPEWVKFDRCICNFYAVYFDDTPNVLRTAIAHFNCVSTEDFVQPIGVGEVFLKKGEKILSNIWCYIFCIWRIEPDDLTCSVSCMCFLPLLFLFNFKFISNPLSFKTCSYSGLYELNIFSFDDSLFSMFFGRCGII